MNKHTRRNILKSAALIAPVLASHKTLFSQNQFTLDGMMHPYPEDWLPEGVRSRFVENVNGLRVHVLEAGFETSGRPALLLLHGFPECPACEILNSEILYLESTVKTNAGRNLTFRF